MTKRKRKKAVPLPPLLTMDKLIAQATTFAESKKRRVRRTTKNLLNVKNKINSQLEKIILGTLERDHIQAHVQVVTCSKCKGTQKHVDFLHVWSHSTIESNSSNRMTTEIKTRGMYDFHRDLPIKIIEDVRFVPVCAECLYLDADLWPPLPDERVPEVVRVNAA